MGGGNAGLFMGMAMLAVFALAAGGIHLIRRSAGDRTRGGLMLAAAAVLLANILILSWPMPA